MESDLKALQLCLHNYEDTVREVQALLKESLNREKATQKKLDKLIHLVKHNTKNSETILKQLGE